MHLQIRKASHSGIDPEAVPSAATTVGMIRWYHQASLRAAADYIDRTFMKPQRNLTELAGLNVNEFQADERAKQPAVGGNKIGVEVSLPTA